MSFSVTRACPVCGVRNRTPSARLADAGRCGSCRATLPPVAAPIDVNTVGDFDDIVGHVRVPVLVDFWAAWCGPCRSAAPEVEKLARELSGRAVILKVNTEALPRLAGRYNVQSIPNFLLFSEGRLVQRQAGYGGRRHLQQLLASVGLASNA